MQTLLYWIWLSQLNISPKARTAVLREFGSAETAFLSEEGSFRKKKGISAQEAELLESRSLTDAEKALNRCKELGIRALPLPDPDYPERLRQIFLPPVVLYIKGALPPVDSIPIISVIGTRHASPYGEKMGEKLAWEISRLGGTVVSLLSSGVDEAAARGALRSGKSCIGVLGTPHDQCRIPIAQDILYQGALISEYPPGRECSRHFFRERNRVAAGLSDGVVVVEAPEKSGTRLFVNDAVEQGKDIFAVPGNADAINAAGTRALLKEGAKLVTCGRDVLEEYLLRYPEAIRLELEEEPLPEENTETEQPADDHQNPKSPEPGAEDAAKNKNSTPDPVIRRQLEKLTEDQLKIIAAIDPSSTHIDDITERTGLSTAKVLAQLTVLEIKGFVRREAGRRFALNITVEK